MAKKTAAVRSTPTAARSITSPKMPKPMDPKKDQPRPSVKTDPIKVRATQTGYYDHARRREGDVFVIADRAAFSSRWMEVVDPRTRERITTAPQALKQAHDELKGGSITRVGDESPSGGDDVFGDD